MRLATTIILSLFFISLYGQINCPCGSEPVLDAGAGFNGYSWSNGGSTQTITGSILCSNNTYAVTVTDDCGITATANYTVIQSSPNITVFINSNQCFLIASVANCINPNLIWTDPCGDVFASGYGQTFQSGLSIQGVYNVELVDCNGCTNCVDTQNSNFLSGANCNETCCDPCPNASITANGIPSCDTPTTFTLNCNGAANIVWNITGGGGLPSGNTFKYTPTSNGTYVVSANYTDDCGDSFTETFIFTINEPTGLTATLVGTPTVNGCHPTNGFIIEQDVRWDCQGCGCGDITLASGGSHNLTVNGVQVWTENLGAWQTPCGTTFAADMWVRCWMDNFEVGDVLVYSATTPVTSDCGGSTTLNYSYSYTLTQDDVDCCDPCSDCDITATIQTPSSNNSFNVCNPTFLASSIPVGCTAPYTFSWADGVGNTATGTSFTTSDDWCNNETRTITLTVTDANGCSGSSSVNHTSCNADTTPITGLAFSVFFGCPTGQVVVNFDQRVLPCCFDYVFNNLTSGETYIISASSNACNSSIQISQANWPSSFWANGLNNINLEIVDCCNTVIASGSGTHNCQ